MGKEVRENGGNMDQHWSITSFVSFCLETIMFDLGVRMIIIPQFRFECWFENVPSLCIVLVIVERVLLKLTSSELVGSSQDH